MSRPAGIVQVSVSVGYRVNDAPFAKLVSQSSRFCGDRRFASQVPDGLPWKRGALRVRPLVKPMRRLVASVCFLAVVPVLAGDGWKKAPFPDWSNEAVIDLVTDSPWAKPETVKLTWHKLEKRPFNPMEVPGVNRSPTAQPGMIQGGSPVGGIGAPKPKFAGSADLLIRWASALPVRQAKALYRQRDERLPPSKAIDLIAPRGGGYVLEIHGVPAEVAHQGPETVADLARQVIYLKTSSGRRLAPIKAEAKVNALTLDIYVTFPDSEPLKLSDGEVEAGGDMQIFKFQRRFPLKAMVYLGNLEI